MSKEGEVSLFLSLVKAGLWEGTSRHISYPEGGDYSVIFRLAEEQSVIGLVAAGIENDPLGLIPKEQVYPFVGATLQLERRNIEMNEFVARLCAYLKEAGSRFLMIKGQGVAQCYERPLWRVCGDVDLLLDKDNYEKSKSLLERIATDSEEELEDLLHKGYKIHSWEVELHGTLNPYLWKSANRVIERVKEDALTYATPRLWIDGEEAIPLPDPNNDVLIVFVHILQHFFHGGIGLRQICDWCRLIWTYKESIVIGQLDARLNEAGLKTEWRVLASLAVNRLGMPADAMPLYDDSKRWKRKANRVLSFIIETGNFGHNRDRSYKQRYPLLIRKTISFWLHTFDGFRQATVFPMDSIRVWLGMIHRGAVAVTKR